MNNDFRINVDQQFQTFVQDSISGLSSPGLEQNMLIVNPNNPTTFSTIQSAIDTAVADGASPTNPKMILITQGTYVENLNITGRGLLFYSPTRVSSFAISGNTPQITGNITVNSDGPVVFENLTLVGNHTFTSTGTFDITDPLALAPMTLRGCLVRSTNVVPFPPFAGPSLTLNGTVNMTMIDGRTQANGTAADPSVVLNNESVLRIQEGALLSGVTVNDDATLGVSSGALFGTTTLASTRDIIIFQGQINGPSPLFDVGAGVSLNLYNCNINCQTGGDWATGAGSVNYSNSGFTAISSTANSVGALTEISSSNLAP